MNFISTKDMTFENAPEGEVLVQYLEPFFGLFTINHAIGYFDNPNNYTDKNGKGWKLWQNEKEINVIAYAILPNIKNIKHELDGIKQIDFKKKFGSFHPNYGIIG